MSDFNYDVYQRYRDEYRLYQMLVDDGHIDAFDQLYRIIKKEERNSENPKSASDVVKHKLYAMSRGAVVHKLNPSDFKAFRLNLNIFCDVFRIHKQLYYKFNKYTQLYLRLRHAGMYSYNDIETEKYNQKYEWLQWIQWRKAQNEISSDSDSERE